MNILFITDRIAQPQQSGGEIRHFQCYRALLECGNVDVFSFQKLEDDLGNTDSFENHPFHDCHSRRFLNRSQLEMQNSVRRRYCSFFGRMSLTFGSLLPFEYRTGIDRRVITILRQMCLERSYDIVWVSCTKIAVSLPNLDRRRVILDGDDFDSVRELRLLLNSKWYGAKTFNYLNVVKLLYWEWRLPRMYRVVARCSEDDRLRFRRCNVAVIPNGTNLPIGFSKKLDFSPRLLYVGMLSYAPNTQGLEWFLANVWIKIRGAIPNAQLDIVGKGASKGIQEFHGKDGVHVYGFQEDLTPFFQRAWISIVPLLAGSGTRLKILESLAFETPVVSTTIGACGIEVDHDDGLFRSDGASEFSEICIKLLNHPTLASVGKLARKSIEGKYEWSVIRARIHDLCEKVTRANHNGCRSLTCD